MAPEGRKLFRGIYVFGSRDGRVQNTKYIAHKLKARDTRNSWKQTGVGLGWVMPTVGMLLAAGVVGGGDAGWYGGGYRWWWWPWVMWLAHDKM